MMTNGTFTHIFHPHNEKMFDNASIDVIVFRYCKNSLIEKINLSSKKITSRKKQMKIMECILKNTFFVYILCLVKLFTEINRISIVLFPFLLTKLIYLV